MGRGGADAPRLVTNRHLGMIQKAEKPIGTLGRLTRGAGQGEGGVGEARAGPRTAERESAAGGVARGTAAGLLLRDSPEAVRVPAQITEQVSSRNPAPLPAARSPRDLGRPAGEGSAPEMGRSPGAPGVERRLRPVPSLRVGPGGCWGRVRRARPAAEMKLWF